jgi:hypothetical protein
VRRPLVALPLVFGLAAILAQACGSSAPTVLDVTVRGAALAAAPTDLEMTLSLDGRSETHRYATGGEALPGVISAELPPGTAGTVEVSVVALAGSDRLGSGSARAALVAGRRNGVTVDVGPGDDGGPGDGGPGDGGDGGRGDGGGDGALDVRNDLGVDGRDPGGDRPDLPRDLAGDATRDLGDGPSPDAADAPAHGPIAPVINQVCPGHVRDGDPFEVDGANFAIGVTVKAGGVTATQTQPATATRIVATVPSGLSGSVPVTVTNPDSGSATRDAALSLSALANLSITLFIKRGNHYDYTISGSGLQGQLEVHFNGSSVTVLSVSGGQISGQVNAQPAGSTAVVEVCYPRETCSVVTPTQICVAAGMVTF